MAKQGQPKRKGGNGTPLPRTPAQGNFPFGNNAYAHQNLTFRAVPKLYSGKGIVVEHGKKQIGRLAYTLEKKRGGPAGWKIDVAVNEQFHKLGIGSRLIRQLVAMARMRNKLAPRHPVQFIQAVVDEDNAASLSMVRKLGFHQTGYNHSGNFKEKQLIFELKI